MIIQSNGLISSFEDGLLCGAALDAAAGLVEGGVHHAAKATFTVGPASCGSFRKVSALQNPGQKPTPHPAVGAGALEPTPDPSREREGRSAADLAGRYVSVSQLQTRPVLRLVDRFA